LCAWVPFFDWCDTVAKLSGEAQTFTTAVTPDNVVVKTNTKSDSSDDEHKRFKVVIKLVALVDLEAVMEYCRGSATSPSNKRLSSKEEQFLTGKQQSNILSGV